MLTTLVNAIGVENGNKNKSLKSKQLKEKKFGYKWCILFKKTKGRDRNFMGQRLNIEINSNGRTLANAYYHWGGFTSSSLELTKLILKNSEKVHHQDSTVRAVRLLETTGALLTSDEVEEMKQRGAVEEFEHAVDRNSGLIAISENGMDSTRRWEEGRVEINIDEKIINFNVLDRYTKPEYLEDYGETDEHYSQLPVLDIKFDQMSFTDFNEFASELLQLIQNKIYRVRQVNGEVVCFIE